jgi:ribosomal protein S18 acetylase RimI-like enzyme
VTDGAGTDGRFERALAFERSMHSAVGRVISADWGQAFVHPEIGRCHEENLIWGVGDAGGLDAAALDSQAERLLGGAGLGHRAIVLEDGTADRLWDGLVARGYDARRNLFLAHDGEPPPAPATPVHEVGIDALLAAERHYLATDPETAYARDEGVRADILEHHRTYGSAGAGERIFAVLDGEAVAAWCKLWTRDGVAQVEDVVCLAEHRGRGHGRAVTAAATRAALDEDPELLFIVAHEDDWPKDLYGRLGYRTVGHIGQFTRLVRV